jgi:hypothetical protein
MWFFTTQIKRARIFATVQFSIGFLCNCKIHDRLSVQTPGLEPTTALAQFPALAQRDNSDETLRWRNGRLRRNVYNNWYLSDLYPSSFEGLLILWDRFLLLKYSNGGVVAVEAPRWRAAALLSTVCSQVSS